MKIFNSLHKKIEQWFATSGQALSINGVTPEQFSFVVHNYLQHGMLKNKNLIICCATTEEADRVHETLFDNGLEHNVYFYPGLDANPYSGHIASEQSLMQRLRVLDTIRQDHGFKIIVGTDEAFLLKTPPQSFFKEYGLNLEVSDIVSPLQLSKKLVDIGYQQTITVEEPGTFSSKGEIFDLHPISGTPVRLHYFDDMIEEMKAIDLESNRTIKDQSFEKVHVAPSVGIFTQSQFTNQLRENIPMPNPAHKEKFERRKAIFSQLSDGNLFENYVSYAPLFFPESESIFDYFGVEDSILVKLEAQRINSDVVEQAEEMRTRYQEESEDINSELILPEPSRLFYPSFEEITKDFKVLKTNHLDIVADFDKDISNSIDFKLQTAKAYLHAHINPALPKHEYLLAAFKQLYKDFEKEGTIIILVRNEHSQKEIHNILETLEFHPNFIDRIVFENSPFQEGFYYPMEKTLIITDGDLFSIRKTSKVKATKKNIDLFAEQLATLKEGDFVIHNDHGIGIYQGLQSMDFGNNKSDFLVIHYKDNDKIYVPVYKMNLVQKHADASAGLSPENLRKSKFNQVKTRAKESAKKLAFNLLKLQAERESAIAFAFTAPDQYYSEFEMAFPFDETPDQHVAIENVLTDMQKPRPMDHLVCGDVGFGKTEVAMRAAFKAVLDKKQVAVLVPTTVLALQHFHSFTRSSNFQIAGSDIETGSHFRISLQGFQPLLGNLSK